ncbi:unnamed protein product [Withania somnifera]
MGFDGKEESAEPICEEAKKGGGGIGDSDSEMEHEVHENKVSRQMSESSMYTTEDEDEDENVSKIELGPQCTLKEQFEKDKDDRSLGRWKEQVLGAYCMFFLCVLFVRCDFYVHFLGKSLDPEVKILSLEIKSPGRADIVLSIPENGKPKSPWFVLKEGSKYSLKFTFQVNNNIVTGLKYTNTVWKTGMKVDSMKEMIGAFSPQAEPYTHEMPEETTPSGMFARGSYSARTKFLDDDNKCYLEINYTFDIKKEWQAI